MPDASPTDDGTASWLDARHFLPLTVAAFLLVASPLVWAGADGSHAALLGLFYGGIATIVVGIFAGLIVGAPAVFSVGLGGILWLGLQRAVLATGAWFRWAAIPVALVGVLLLPGALRRTREVLRERARWAATKGGSVPP